MDKALKQRLVGASVLIALGVVVLPMLLGGRPDGPQEPRSIEVPPKPAELSFETRRFPVGDQPADRPSVVQRQDVDPVTEQSVTPEPVASQPPAQAVAEPSVQPPVQQPTEKPSPSPAAGRYLVQVGSFRTTSNANALAARLQADNLPVLMDSIESEVGVLHRVRVGPFDALASAEQAMQSIQSRTPDVSPRVIDLRPEDPAPVTQPSDPLVRWVVQVGSFSLEDNAAQLVNDLRARDFAAYSVVQRDASGTAYKVRIGPVIERQMAIDLNARLKTDTGRDGIVMSVD